MSITVSDQPLKSIFFVAYQIYTLWHQKFPPGKFIIYKLTLQPAWNCNKLIEDVLG